MRRCLFLKQILAMLIPFLWNYNCYSQLPPADPSYKLVFQDEFEKKYSPDPIDPKKWSRSAPWNQQSNVTDNVAWCFPGDTTSKYWDRAYTVKDPADTTTVNVSHGTCRIITNKADYQGQVSNWPPCN